MAKPHKARRTKKYSDEFKDYAVMMSYEPDLQVQEVARRLDIHPFMLSRWRKEHREEHAMSAPGSPNDRKPRKPPKAKRPLSEVELLKREIARLEKENDLLKKWQRYLAELNQQDSSS